MNNSARYIADALNHIYEARCSMCSAALELYKNGQQDSSDIAADFAYELSKIDDIYGKKLNIVRFINE